MEWAESAASRSAPRWAPLRARPAIRARSRLGVVHLNELKGGAVATAHLVQIDVTLECTGKFLTPETLQGHLDRGAGHLRHKDLTKTASTSAIKATAGDASVQLFKWVAFFTGSKNAMKGVGFFLARQLLQAVGFQAALWIMTAGLAVVFIGVVSFVRRR